MMIKIFIYENIYMLDFLSNIFNFTNSKPIFPPRKSKLSSINMDDVSENEEDLDNINASETSISDSSISDSSSELQSHENILNIDELSETSISENMNNRLVLNSDIETDINNLLETDQLSETSYATITELSGGMKETSFIDIKQDVKSFGSILDNILVDLNNMLD